MPIGDFGQIVNIHKTLAECMKTWKSNLEETKQHYLDWWNHKGIVLNMGTLSGRSGTACRGGNSSPPRGSESKVV